LLGIIPDELNVALVVLGILGILIGGDWINHLAAAVFGAAFFGGLVAATRGKGMGMGDVKLAGVMGLFLGASILPAMVIGFLTGSVVGIAMFVRYGPAARKMGVPFGPFLALGGFVALLLGPQLIHLYTHHFL
jgi:leader peptidase (prepilin peptidase)/N-methyltransferase